MRNKISFATTLTTVLLFVLLTSVKVPSLFFTAFLLLLARGITMYLQFTGEVYELKENQPEENGNKLFLIRLFMQLIPIAFVALCFYIFFSRKEIWSHFF